jgi:aminoglycoside phosphotransferase (APT) family kinase protein
MTAAAAGEPLQTRLERYLSKVWAAEVKVRDLARIPGGASRETYRFDAEVDGSSRGLILRRDPTGSLIDTDRHVEFLAYKSFHGIVPVPEAMVLERDGDLLERPFFIMSRVDGGKVASVMMAEPYGAQAARVGNELFSILGRIARCDPQDLPIRRCFAMPASDACWRAALDAWQAVIERDERHPQPIVRAAMRRLRNNPPKPAQKISVVHGDYRSGNFLHDGAGRILAVLDWEMAHLGDPLEDLAWGLGAVWQWSRDGLAGSLLPKAEAIRIWEAASGLRAEPRALLWWELFSCVKGQGIWVSGGREFQAGSNHDPVLCLSSWMMGNSQDRAALALLGRLP